METGDRRPVARAYGGASGDRGGRGGRRAQPHAGPGAPEVRPRRLTPDGVGVSAAPPLIRAPRWPMLHRVDQTISVQSSTIDLGEALPTHASGLVWTGAVV